MADKDNTIHHEGTKARRTARTEEAMMGENRYRIATVYQAGKVLEVVANSKEPMGAAEIAKALDIKVNMAFRQCCTLDELGLLRQIGDKFDLGMKLAIFWARKKSRLEGERDRVDADLKTLEEVGDA